MLTTTSHEYWEGRAITVSQPLLKDLPTEPLADSCSFPVSSRATPRERRCSPAGYRRPSVLPQPIGTHLIHSFMHHAFQPSLPGRFPCCQMGAYSSRALD